jgi:hypothetical protein
MPRVSDVLIQSSRFHITSIWHYGGHDNYCGLAVILSIIGNKFVTSPTGLWISITYLKCFQKN